MAFILFVQEGKANGVASILFVQAYGLWGNISLQRYYVILVQGAAGAHVGFK